MTIIVQADFYAALDTETRIIVQQRTSEIKALMKRAATDIIEIGQKLIEDASGKYFVGQLISPIRKQNATA